MVQLPRAIHLFQHSNRLLKLMVRFRGPLYSCQRRTIKCIIADLQYSRRTVRDLNGQNEAIITWLAQHPDFALRSARRKRNRQITNQLQSLVLVRPPNVIHRGPKGPFKGPFVEWGQLTLRADEGREGQWQVQSNQAIRRSEVFDSLADQARLRMP